MLEHTIRLHTRKTIYLICHFLHAYFTLYRLVQYILSCQILFLFYLKMMTWSHRHVVFDSFHLFSSRLTKSNFIRAFLSL